MTKAGKSDGEGTFPGTRGNDKVAPIADLPFLLLLVMESAEAEPFRQPGRGWPS
jgi:hypothetical protein